MKRSRRFTHKCLTVPLLASLLVHGALYFVFADRDFGSKTLTGNPLVVSLRYKPEGDPGQKSANKPTTRSASSNLAESSIKSSPHATDFRTPDVIQKPTPITPPLPVATRTATSRTKMSQPENPEPVPARINSAAADLPRMEGMKTTSNLTEPGTAEALRAAPSSHKGESSGSGNDLVETSFGAVDGPRLMSMPLLRYPPRAKRLRQEGCVLLLLEIDKLGELVKVSLQESAGSGFDEVALNAVAMARFYPAERNGRPVACRASLPITFRL